MKYPTNSPKLLQNLNRATENDAPWVLADGENENARDESHETHDAVKIYKREAPSCSERQHKNIVVFSANEDDAAARCVDVFLRQDGSYGFDEFRRDDGQGWTPTLPDFYSREKFASAAEARADDKRADESGDAAEHVHYARAREVDDAACDVLTV